MAIQKITESIPIIKNKIGVWNKQDTMWMLSLYGTAIGAGTLFLPINAGLHGIWPLIFMSLLAFPMTYFSHQGLCRFVLSGYKQDSDITTVVDEHFGHLTGNVLTFLYFFAIYPILLMYCVAMTNTAESFILHQLHMHAPPRALLAIVLIFILMGIVRFGRDVILRFMSILVYPFIAILVTLSIYLIPYWNNAIFKQSNHLNGAGLGGMLFTLCLIIPVMVFSFNHSPIISSFAVSQKSQYHDDADKKSALILKCSHILMVTTVMFFVISCVLSLSPQDLLLAKQQNISILSYLANHFDTPLLSYIAPFIAFIAIAKSFLGHYLGASEGLQGLILKGCRELNRSMDNKRLTYFVEFFMIITCWITATLNPSILGMIETLGGPIIAMILFIMPVVAIYKIPALHKFRQPLSNIFTIVIGVIAISGILFGLIHF